MPSSYEILGILPTSTKEEIRRAYKEIAITCHPDKLNHITDENERKLRIDKFKSATVAYNKLLNNEADLDYGNDETDWTASDFSDILYDIAKMFFNNKIYPKQYYNPKQSDTDPLTDTSSTDASSQTSSNTSSTTTSTSSVTSSVQHSPLHSPLHSPRSVIVHNVKLEVTYAEIINNAKKRLRLFLNDVPDPVFVDVYCGCFPEVIVRNNNHEIMITMNIKPVDNYDHIVSESHKSIDLITSIEITLVEYILGYTKSIRYVDGSSLKVTIPPFHSGNIFEVPNKGLLKGSLLLNINMKHINKNKWNKLPENDKVEMLRILNALHKMI